MVVINSMFTYHFVDPDLRVEIFFKTMGAAENECVDFEIEDIGTSTHLYWKLKKISCRACLLFHYFLGDTKKLLKIGTFIPLLLKFFFCLPSYSSRSSKRYPLRLLLCLETLGKEFPRFSGRDWEGVCRKLLSVVKLYHRF